MMLVLIRNVRHRRPNRLIGNAKRPISTLPGKVLEVFEFLFDPNGGIHLGVLDRVGDRLRARESKQHMNMVIMATNQDRDMTFRFENRRDVGEQGFTEFLVEPRRSMLGAEHTMDNDLRERL